MKLEILGIVAFSVITGYWFGQHHESHPKLAQINAPHAGKPARKVYVCPMHSHIVQDHPGTCPICGMDLVEEGAASQTEAGLIHVDSATQQKLGIRMATVQNRALSQKIHSYATVVSDDGTLYQVAPTVDGVLVSLKATQTGQRIEAHQSLYEIQSQELIQLQHEYFDFLTRKSQTLAAAQYQREQNMHTQNETTGLDEAGREQMKKSMQKSEELIRLMLQPMERDEVRITTHLKYAGITEDMLHGVVKTRHALTVVPVKTQRPCLVKAIGARPGMVVSANTPIVTCVDNEKLWLEVALYPDQLPFIRTGDKVSIQLENGDRFDTRLARPSDILDSASRTVRVRLPVSGHGMRIGDYADVTIQSAARQALSVPRGAILHTGHGDFAITAKGQGHFLPVKVITGMATDEYVEIKQGLTAGDSVAVNGQFMLDSAASLQDAAMRMQTSHEDPQ